MDNAEAAEFVPENGEWELRNGKNETGDNNGSLDERKVSVLMTGMEHDDGERKLELEERFGAVDIRP